MADSKTKTEVKVRDVVCGKEINPDMSQYSVTYQGQAYYFDSAECKKQFQEDPGQYAN